MAGEKICPIPPRNEKKSPVREILVTAIAESVCFKTFRRMNV